MCRELAMQLADQFRALGAGMSLSVSSLSALTSALTTTRLEYPPEKAAQSFSLLGLTIFFTVMAHAEEGKLARGCAHRGNNFVKKPVSQLQISISGHLCAVRRRPSSLVGWTCRRKHARLHSDRTWWSQPLGGSGYVRPALLMYPPAQLAQQCHACVTLSADSAMCLPHGCCSC